MCGIAGFYGNFNSALLESMGNFISLRGPDGSGNILLDYQDKRIGLAHTRLSIIDLSNMGRQPLTVRCHHCQSSTTHNESLWITYNGELYNYKQLKSSLITKGHTFFSDSDTEVVLHLYAEHGPDMLSMMQGIYAFAIYDGRENAKYLDKGSMFVARDGFGVKPFYYAQIQEGFLFASEIKSLLACEKISLSLDVSGIVSYATYLWSPGSTTGLSSIKKLCPGEAMIIKNGEVSKKWRFYSPVYNNQRLDCSTEDIVTNLQQKIENAVSSQMIADVPIGAFLSGGLDSSVIVAMMKKLNSSQVIDCFTINSNNGKNHSGFENDLFYARKVSKYLGVNLHEVTIGSDIISELSDMIFYLDEPQADPAPINVLLISKFAKKMGLKVLMSGAGGDDIFTGYRRHAALNYEYVWSFFPKPIKKLLARLARNIVSGNLSIPLSKSHFIRRMLKVLCYIDYPKSERLISYFFWGTPQLRNALFNIEFLQNCNFDDFQNTEMLSTLSEVRDEKSLLNQLLYLEKRHFLADHNLNYTDKMGMAAGVEIRVPLLDQGLVEFAMKVPPNLKQHGKEGKYIFKKAMEPYLPHDVIYRKKTGFGAPIRQWVKGDMSGLICETLSKEAVEARGIFNYKEVSRLISLNSKGYIDGAHTIFSLVCIELWCQIFVDKKHGYFDSIKVNSKIDAISSYV